MKVLIDNGLGYQDYTRYVLDGSLTLEDSVNVPTICNFILSPVDNLFKIPRRSSYVKIVSEVYAANGGYGSGKILFTGFITSEPEREFLGLSGKTTSLGNHQYAYRINATSDEWLINCNSVPYIPAFVNQTQGQILAGIATALAPGFFDVTSFVASGDIVPYYEYSPDKTWSDIAKEFGDSIRYRYKVIDKKIYFQPFSDAPLGISYDERQAASKFMPLALATSVVTVPPVNDAIVLGAVEPQESWENYFIGDGFTSQFRLRHKVFRGDTAILLQDDWTSADFQSNFWNVQDPLNWFALASNGQAIGRLNVVSDLASVALGQEYILGVNGIELGGGLNLQHGEVEFVDHSEGIIGGIYQNTVLSQANCIAGFGITSSGTLVVGASGAGGVIIQPLLYGQPVGPQIVSQVNHTYSLQTLVGVTRWDRYQRIYRSLTGDAQFGGNPLSASGTITFMITDNDLGLYAALLPTATQNTIVPQVTRYSVTTDLPEFAVYAPVNAVRMNITLQYTLLAQPPQGSLFVRSLTDASGMLLPVLPENLGPEVHYTLGFGLQGQTATIQSNGDSQFLAFYSDRIPGVGSRIRFQSWSAGQAVARVRDTAAIANEAVISGDSGVRSAIMANLSPQPRTSDECELAAAAAIHDRSFPQFQGSYTVESIPYRFETLYNPATASGYPMAGRELFVYAPLRGVSGQYFVVHTARIQVVELRQEVLQITVDYGPDLYLERLLQNFTQRTDRLLTPKETVKSPDPVALSQVGTFYAPMLNDATIIQIQDTGLQTYTTHFVASARVVSHGVNVCQALILNTGPLPFAIGSPVTISNEADTSFNGNFTVVSIAQTILPPFRTPYYRVQWNDSGPLATGGSGTITSGGGQSNWVTIDVGVDPITAAEIRNVDRGWGHDDAYLLARITQRSVSLPRTSRDQTWYVRQVNGPYISRFSKALRVVYPMIPAPPVVKGFSNSSLVLDYNGVVSDIYGVALSVPGISGTIVVQLPPGVTQVGDAVISNPNRQAPITPSTVLGPQGSVTGFQRQAALNNTTATVVAPDGMDVPSNWIFGGDVVQVTSTVDSSFAGLKLITDGVVRGPAGTVCHVSWIDYNAPFPLSNTGSPAGTLRRYFRPAAGKTQNVISAQINSGIVTLTTQFTHHIGIGDTIMVGVNWVNPSTGLPNIPVFEPQSLGNGAFINGQFAVTSVPASNQVCYRYTNAGAPKSQMVPTPCTGVVTAFQVVDTTSGTVTGGTVSGALGTAVISAQGVLIARPVFTSTDLIFDLTDPGLQQVLSVASQINAGVVPIVANFFNLMWDYSSDLNVTNTVSPAISGLRVDASTKQAQWDIIGNPTYLAGTRVQITDSVTGVVYGRYALDNPANPRKISQFKLSDDDYYSDRLITVTPFSQLGDGPALQLLHPAGGGAGAIPVSGAQTQTYSFGCTYNGSIPYNYTVMRLPLDQYVRFLPNFAGSQGYMDTPPSNGLTWKILQGIGTNPVFSQVGTMAFSAGQRRAVFSSTMVSGAFFSPTDILAVQASGTDLTAQDLGFILYGGKYFTPPSVSTQADPTTPSVSGGTTGPNGNLLVQRQQGQGTGTVVLTFNNALQQGNMVIVGVTTMAYAATPGTPTVTNNSSGDTLATAVAGYQPAPGAWNIRNTILYRVSASSALITVKAVSSGGTDLVYVWAYEVAATQVDFAGTSFGPLIPTVTATNEFYVAMLAWQPAFPTRAKAPMITDQVLTGYSTAGYLSSTSAIGTMDFEGSTHQSLDSWAHFTIGAVFKWV